MAYGAGVFLLVNRKRLFNLEPLSVTTIAWDGSTLAADTRQTGQYIDQVSCKKIFEVNGAHVGLAGNSGAGFIFIKWFKDQTKPKPDMSALDGFEALVVRKRTCLFYDKYCEPIVVGSPASIGSGGDIAMGAMMAGATATEAVKIAMKLDVNTGGKVQSIQIK